MSFSQSPLTPAETDLSNDELGGSPFDSVMERQMNLLGLAGPNHVPQDANTAPLFTAAVLKHTRDNSSSPNIPYSQYGFLAGDVERLLEGSTADPRIFYNVSAPSSVFICGSQGSGKSHTLSCILEDCLIQSDTLGTLRNPLTAVVFHYDDYASDLRVAPCEAAYLGSDPSVSVRVLCAPTNVALIKESYRIFPNATVEPLKLDESNLNTRRMLELMAFDKTQPLYMQVLQRILRDMRLEQQVTRGGFRYSEFKRRLISEDLLPTQKQVLQQRLDTLESFMVESQTSNSEGKKPGEKKKKKKKLVRGTNWNPKAGELIIVDLSCPCVTATMACVLFNICLSIFLEQDSSIGRVVALDEAHRYMGESSECETLTNSLLAAIRLQRHLGVRTIISTQEPTISPKLLDLCSITIVHQFSSPDWLSALTKHLAGISTASKAVSRMRDEDSTSSEKATTSLIGPQGVTLAAEDPVTDLFSKIVGLPQGHAFVFAPRAVVALEKRVLSGGKCSLTPQRLAHNILRVVIRNRITSDGGQSIMAS